MLRPAGEESVGGATLIVCPTSLVGQWADELHFRAGCTETSRGGCGGLQLVLYHGGRRDELPPRLDSRLVVLTSYGTLASEWSSAGSWGGAGGAAAAGGGAGGGAAARRRTGGPPTAPPLYRTAWRRVILAAEYAFLCSN